MPVQPTTAMTADHAQHVQSILRRLAPKWTTHIVHTMAKYGPELRIRDVAQYYPQLATSYVSKRLSTMDSAGLLTRGDAQFDQRAPYRLTPGALTLGPLYRAVAQWSTDHLDRTPQGRSERIEDALHRLQLADTTEVIRLLSHNGTMHVSDLAEHVGVYEQFVATRLNRMQTDGLVTRTGTRHGDPYILTDAGRALGPVYTAVQQWDNRHTASAQPTVPAATRTLDTPAPTAGRTAAALRRSAAPWALFSHAQLPPQRVPAYVTAASHPSRSR
ncbi:winged helix-turn-helix transcriptional regulator [Kitasatospora sp. LaBMicrA B282]|uniref:winged helix-turn-helix transcriptional regulator n=1 Tax=Kitasatospora sp. LaBMicrA B282 TaxID=3420949 RepID=UPI003D0B08DD